MRIVALLAVRNEEYYLENCLRYLYGQDIETCLIDNESTDRTLEIAKDYTGQGVFRIEHVPFTGIFEWLKILELKSQLALEIDANWFIHHDADEVREAPAPFYNLVDGITDADKKGYNAINSDEFVFTPTSNTEAYENKNFMNDMKYYYYFKPQPLHRVNIWKKIKVPIDLASSGGHSVSFENRKIYPLNFILRHYILLSKQHALDKYGNRNYDPKVFERGMNIKRAMFNPEKIKFPDKKDLKIISSNGEWDLSDPWKQHFFL